MTIRDLLLLPARQILLSVHFLLLAAQMALLFTCFRDKRSFFLRLSMTLQFLAGFLIFYLMMCYIGTDALTYDETISYPVIISAFGSLPAGLIILYELLSAGLLLAALADLIRFRKTHPTSGSIKESMDLLPVGIAFGKEDGTVVLSNLVINDLSRCLTGKRLRNVAAFESTFQKPTDLVREAAHGLTLPDGSIWQISSEKTQVDGTSYTQLTAADITQQAMIARELEASNQKLRDIHMRLEIYNKQAERMTIAKELLDARIQVHSEAGQVLLMSRHYLDHPESIDEKGLLQTLKSANLYLLREYEEDDSARDPLLDAMELAEAIGVEVDLTGEYPNSRICREILGTAIGECATNTVKHAGGDHLFIETGNDGDSIIYRLSSKGDISALSLPADMVEGGGLSSLRRRVENAGGEMTISKSSAFTVTIRLPKEIE